MKSKAFRRRSIKPGSAPGILTAAENALATHVQVIGYNKDDIVETPVKTVAEIKGLLDQWAVCWINVDGLADTNLIEELGQLLGLHPLALEDVVNTHQRPKVEDYETNLYIVTRMVTPAKGSGGDDLELEQVSIFLGRNFVLSFQEKPGDCFDPVRERLRKGVGKRIRTQKADYLSYALLDALVDSFFPLLESYGTKLDDMEDAVLMNPTDDTMATIHATKRTLQGLRHVIWPLRDALSAFNSEHDLVHDETRVFIRDCQDHVVQLLDILENYRERAGGLTDLYLTSLSNKLNEVMKVLTIIATIFMPLGFLVGMYGMNFDTSSPWNMPELRQPYGYPVLILVMLGLAFGMMAYFRKLGWLGSPKKKDPPSP